MLRVGTWAVAIAAAVGASLWAGLALTAQEPKPVDLSDLREVVEAAAKRGDNVDPIRKALDAFEKVAAAAKPGTVPAELQALRDAVEAAARKGENVEAIAKELTAVEMAVAGKSLAKPRPEPVPEPVPDPNPNPFNPRPFVRPVRPVVPFPEVPFPNPPAVGGIDAQALQKAMDLRIKAMELMAANPRDPEARKLLLEANEQMLKSLRGAGGGRMPVPALPDLPDFPNLPDLDRIPFPNFDPLVPASRPRLGVTVERLSPVLVEQLGLEPNVGVVIASVLPGSVAEKAGLKAHDIVVEFAGQPVTATTDEFVRRVGAAKAGEKLDLVVLRKGKKVEIKGVVLPDLGRAPVAPNLPPNPAVPDVPPGRKPLPLPPLPEPSLPQVKPVIDEAPVNVLAAAEAPDLGDLRDEVAAAEKRGANVGDVRTALIALDKALAKGVKGGEPLPELAAVREAVEKALKKGEAVDAISDELGRVEKALTGRAFERPKAEPVPEPALPPVPQFPRRGGFGRQGGVIIGGNGVIGGGAGAMSVVISNDSFVIRSRQGEVSYTITGSTTPNGAVKFTIKDAEKTVEADDLKKVPEEYRPTAEKLLKSVGR